MSNCSKLPNFISCSDFLKGRWAGSLWLPWQGSTCIFIDALLLDMLHRLAAPSATSTRSVDFFSGQWRKHTAFSCFMSRCLALTSGWFLSIMMVMADWIGSALMQREPCTGYRWTNNVYVLWKYDQDNQLYEVTKQIGTWFSWNSHVVHQLWALHDALLVFFRVVMVCSTQ